MSPSVAPPPEPGLHRIGEGNAGACCGDRVPRSGARPNHVPVGPRSQDEDGVGLHCRHQHAHLVVGQTTHGPSFGLGLSILALHAWEKIPLVVVVFVALLNDVRRATMVPPLPR